MHQRDALVRVSVLDFARQLAARVAAARDDDALRPPDLLGTVKVELVALHRQLTNMRRVRSQSR